MTTPKDVLFAGMRRPTAPPGLRERALGAARAAFHLPDAVDVDAAASRRPTRLDRLWESRGLRLAWAATFLVAVASNLLLAAPYVSTPAVRPGVSAADGEPEIRELMQRYPDPAPIRGRQTLADARRAVPGLS